MNSETIRPSRLFYGVAGGVFIIGIAAFIIILIKGIFSSVDQIDTRVVVPGTEVIELEGTGKYNIYFEHRSVVDGKVFETSNINGLMCTLKNTATGEFINLTNPSLSSNYSVGGRKGYSIFEFSITKRGSYELTAWYESGDGEEAVLAISKGLGSSILKIVFLCLGILFVTIGLSLTIFIVTLRKRRKANNTKLNQQSSYNNWG